MQGSLPFFASTPVFTRAEFASATGSENRRTVDSLLRYHVGRHRILRVRRDLYTVVPQGADVATFHPDAYLVAGRASPSAVISHHSALELHGLAYAAHPGRVIATTAEATRSFDFRGREFRFVRPPRSLRRAGPRDSASDERPPDAPLTVSRAGLLLRVTTPERTVVDVLDRPDLGDGLSATWEALHSLGSVRADRVVAYVERLGHRSTAGLVGLLLSRLPREAGVGPEILARLRTLAPRRPVNVGPLEGGVLAAPWNVIVPAALIAPSEEPVA
ncbi:MAG: transcriptional regulator [Planctomycetes bacterium]|nr:transcriptional regulator [Planctomycetota bacterium]